MNIFVILIPVWLLLLYGYAFMVLVGLASKNSRVNTCEKIFLSLLVPIGFTTTIVLSLCRLEGYFQLPIYIIIIPEGGSMLFLYLYVRCLVKPSKGYFNRVDHAEDEANKQLASSGNFQQAASSSPPKKEEMKKEDSKKPPLPPKAPPPTVKALASNPSSPE